MGACASTLAPGECFISEKDRVEFIKLTPFFMFLKDDMLVKFARCFPKVRRLVARLPSPCVL